MNPTIEELTAAIEQEAKKWPEVLRLMAPWRGSADGTGFRADHRNSRAVQVRQKDRQLCWTDPVGGLQCRPSTAGPHSKGRGRATLLIGIVPCVF
jgi:hypothetical protein